MVFLNMVSCVKPRILTENLSGVLSNKLASVEPRYYSLEPLKGYQRTMPRVSIAGDR